VVAAQVVVGEGLLWALAAAALLSCIAALVAALAVLRGARGAARSLERIEVSLARIPNQAAKPVAATGTIAPSGGAEPAGRPADVGIVRPETSRRAGAGTGGARLRPAAPPPGRDLSRNAVRVDDPWDARRAGAAAEPAGEPPTPRTGPGGAAVRPGEGTAVPPPSQNASAAPSAGRPREAVMPGGDIDQPMPPPPPIPPPARGAPTGPQVRAEPGAQGEGRIPAGRVEPAPVIAHAQPAVPAARPVPGPPAVRGLDNADPFVRVEALDALQGLPEQRQALLGALSDEFPMVRREAIRVLRDHADTTAVRALVNVANNDPSSEVREEAVAALAALLRGARNRRPSSD
jgi:hypothetical protein